VTDVFAPLTGEVVDVNALLQDETQLVNDDSYGEGWLIRVRMTAQQQIHELMDTGDYRLFLDEA